MNSHIADDIARLLLDIGAVSIQPQQPFTWASGKRSPLYCDNRLVMGHVTGRKQVRDAFAQLIKTQGWQPDVIAGTATAGIAHAAWLADVLDLPMVYIRGSEKGHGKRNRIEGRIEPQWRAVVIEDLISTGGSVIDAAQALQEADVAVVGIAAIFRYGLTEEAGRFAAAGLTAKTLTDLNHLVSAAVATGALTDKDRQVVEQWRQDPSAWSKQRGGA